MIDDGSKIPFGCDKSSGHLAFDICMTLEQKARWVKDGHKTPEPEWYNFDGFFFWRERLHCINTGCSERSSYLRL